MRHLIQTAFCATALTMMNLAGAADLTIRVDDVKSADGTIMLALYGSADTFLKKPLGSAMEKAVKGSTTLLVKDLAPGDYAYAVYHDANANVRMDANMMGIPTEDYGFSNNAVGKMGPPKFDNARFTLPAAGLTTAISLTH